MRQCGLENFTVEVIERCDNHEQLNEREKFWIRVLNCKVPNGYNQSDGGESGWRYPKAKVEIEPNIGESLRRFRTALRLKQSDIADALGMTQPYYTKYETETVRAPAAMIYKLAKIYGVSADYLLGLTDEPRPQKYDDDEIAQALALRAIFRAEIQKAVVACGCVQDNEQSR